ncbi:kinase-like domain-containing protein, partial [Mycena galericulata]
GTHLTTTVLLQHEHGGGLPGEAKTLVCWQAKTTYIDSNLGSSSKKWANSLFLNDIKSDLLKSINIEWTKTTPIPLSDEDASFRWCHGRLLERDTSSMTLGDFYAYHSTPTNAPIYLMNVPTMFKHFLKTARTQPFICLEMYLGLISEVISNGSGNMDTRKRGRTESTRTEPLGNASKQLRPTVPGDVVPESQFSRSRRSELTVQQQSEITFKRINCITAVSTGQCTLVDSGEIFRGFILDKPFASGRMKHAYHLQLANNEQYVAKRFYKLNESDCEDDVSVQNNRLEVEGEIFRLGLGKWFLDAFYRFVKTYKDSVAVDMNIEVADAFLAQEIDRPSNASGGAMITEEDDGVTWLVERRRPATVIKFSGTLIHRSARRDLRSVTIGAFAHFVFGYSKQELVFADLQGTPCQLKTRDGFGKDGLVLFDLMTHTLDSDSGVGDFGIEGIKTFVKDHECNEICRGLALHESYPLVIDLQDNAGDGNEKEGSDEEEFDAPEELLQVHG